VAKHSGGLELTWTDKDKTLLSVGDGQYDYTFVDSFDYRVSEDDVDDAAGSWTHMKGFGR
jgi:hypothetical protein